MIGQACEFDYSGVQAVKALKDEGYRVILFNSNPATVMNGPRRAAFDALMDAASEELQAADRLNLLREAERIFIAEMSSIPLLHERAYWMVANRVEAREDIQPQLWRDLVLD